MGGLDERAKRIIQRGREHPEVRSESLEGRAGRVISARLRPGTDLITGLKDLVGMHRITAGAVTVCFGSLSRAEVTWTEGSKPDPKKQPRERFDTGSYNKALKAAIKKAGVPNWHPHQLRHTAASAVREALGIDAAKALVGHSTTQMTEHYAHLSVNAAIRAASVTPKLTGV